MPTPITPRRPPCTAVYTFRIPAPLLQQLTTLSAAMGCSASELARAMLEAGLAECREELKRREAEQAAQASSSGGAPRRRLRRIGEGRAK